MFLDTLPFSRTDNTTASHFISASSFFLILPRVSKEDINFPVHNQEETGVKVLQQYFTVHQDLPTAHLAIFLAPILSSQDLHLLQSTQSAPLCFITTTTFTLHFILFFLPSPFVSTSYLHISSISCPQLKVCWPQRAHTAFNATSPFLTFTLRPSYLSVYTP